ncbi:MAG TPA: tetratricopeptide repeat protein [Thermoanaerobaculia bacterium]|nr:tetratricopeptide repeat protein [Thermoanaerobaculia bacterium]
MALFRKDPQQVAEKLVAKGRVEAAIREYRKVLERSPDDPNTLNRIGDLLVRLRKSAEAADYYERTAERYAADGFTVKAIAVYKKIHRIEPGRPQVLRRLAELYERQGLINDARAHYTQLADHYARQENHRALIETYQRMVELEPDNPTPRLKLADTHRSRGHLDRALAVYLELGALMVKHGRADHAQQVYERAIELAPEDLGFVRAAMSVLHRAGDAEAAERLIAAAEALNPDAAELRREPPVEPGDAGAETAAAGRGWATSDPPLEGADDGGFEGWQAIPESARETAAADTEEGAAVEAGSAEQDLEEAPEDGIWEISGSWSFSDEAAVEEIELDPLGDLAAQSERAEVPAPSAPAAEERSAEAETEAATVAVEDRRRVDRQNDLLSEADVFLKYGLSQKAVERLEELLELNSDHLGAIERLLAARLERGEEQAVLELAQAVRAGERGGAEPATWARVESLLRDAGYRIEDGRLLALATGTLPATAVGELASSRGHEAAAPPVETRRSDDIVAPAAFQFRPDGSDSLADSDLLDSSSQDLVASSWLEEEAPTSGGNGDRIFEEERGFFDLASELRPDLEASIDGVAARGDEPSLDQIVEGFKRGVAENISEEDADTHYNLGIAYREMMLIDEAIGEFQIAAKSPDYRIDACAMLGLCYREKGMADLAVKWYRRALESADLEDAQRAGVLYDLAQTFESIDDREAAYETYLELRGIDDSFRDVSERIEALQ